MSLHNSNHSLMQSLGIQSLSTEHLLEIGKVLIRQMDDGNSRQQAILVAKWLACVYRSLDDFGHDTELVAALRDLPMVLVAGGEVVSLSQRSVFFPVDDDKRRQAGQKQHSGKWCNFYVVLGQLQTMVCRHWPVVFGLIIFGMWSLVYGLCSFILKKMAHTKVQLKYWSVECAVPPPTSKVS